MIPRPRKGDKWGRWTIVRHNAETTTVRCSCGVERTLKTRQYLTGYLSVMCRKCRENTERLRHTRLFNPHHIGIEFSETHHATKAQP